MLLIFENDLKLQRIGKKRRNRDSSTISTFLLANIIRKEREWYILPRSTHWVEVCLFSSEFFSDAQFKESFRMSRTSFYTLHELLRPFIEKKSTQFREPVQGWTTSVSVRSWSGPVGPRITSLDQPNRTDALIRLDRDRSVRPIRTELFIVV